MYFEASFVEFLEFFARLADLKYKDGQYKNLSLVEKIGNLMDTTFHIVKCKKKEPFIEEEYASVSEEDLIEDNYII